MAKDPKEAIASAKNILSVNEDIDLSSSGGELFIAHLIMLKFVSPLHSSEHGLIVA
jgi:hypothetical protein